MSDYAEQNAKKIMDSTSGPVIHALIKEAVELVRSNLPFGWKAERITTMATSLSTLITPFTPCKDGCSHCCHMAVAVSDHEAKQISKYSGRPMYTEGHSIDEWDEEYTKTLQSKYTGVICPFLRDAQCSIYPVRPLACRLHHNLEATADNCKITGDRNNLPSTPVLNLSEFMMAQAAVQYLGGCKFADIREFFPKDA